MTGNSRSITGPSQKHRRRPDPDVGSSEPCWHVPPHWCYEVELPPILKWIYHFYFRIFPPTEAMRWSCHLIWIEFFIILCSLPLWPWGGVATSFEVDLSFLLSYFHSHWDYEVGLPPHLKWIYHFYYRYFHSHWGHEVELPPHLKWIYHFYFRIFTPTQTMRWVPHLRLRIVANNILSLNSNNLFPPTEAGFILICIGICFSHYRSHNICSLLLRGWGGFYPRQLYNLRCQCRLCQDFWGDLDIWVKYGLKERKFIIIFNQQFTLWQLGWWTG